MSKFTHILRSCKNDLTSTNNFQYPASGMVECDDFDPKPTCGGGLHGFLLGVGDISVTMFKNSIEDKWLIIKVLKEDIVEVTENNGGKVKFKKGEVVKVGNLYEATKYLSQVEDLEGLPVIGSTSENKAANSVATSGYHGTSTSGWKGTSTSGDKGTSTSGWKGTSTSGDKGTSTSGDYGTSASGFEGTSTSGLEGTSISGYYGTSTSGDYGTSTSGNGGTSTSGDYGTSTSGDYGTSTSGNNSTSISGLEGKVKSGESGVLCLILYFNGRKMILGGNIGEDNLEPNVFYTHSKDGKSFVKLDR